MADPLNAMNEIRRLGLELQLKRIRDRAVEVLSTEFASDEVRRAVLYVLNGERQ